MNKGDSAARLKGIVEYFKKCGWYSLGYRIIGDQPNQRETIVWNIHTLRFYQVWSCNQALKDHMEHPQYDPGKTNEELKRDIYKIEPQELFPAGDLQTAFPQRMKTWQNKALSHYKVLCQILEEFGVDTIKELMSITETMKQSKHKLKG